MILSCLSACKKGSSSQLPDAAIKALEDKLVGKWDLKQGIFKEPSLPEETVNYEVGSYIEYTADKKVVRVQIEKKWVNGQQTNETTTNNGTYSVIDGTHFEMIGSNSISWGIYLIDIIDEHNLKCHVINGAGYDITYILTK